MSGPAEQWAWQLQDERLSLSEKFVLVYLARRAYYDDGCGAWPSVNTIAAHCHCTRRSVLRALKRLQELGYLREGDQELAARNPRSHEPIPRSHRSKVWDVVMKGARTEPEDITDPGETGAGKDVPAKPSTAEPSRSKECARGDMVSPDAVSPDTMSPQGDPAGEVTSCPKRGDVMSPNRQVITNAPLVPYGDIPLSGEQPEEERSEHDAPDWRLALPPKGVRDPLWVPGAEDADERVRSRALQEVRVLTLIHDRVAAIDPKAARPASMRDRRKVHELLMERSLAEVETILDWAYGNPRWISWLVDGTMVERYFAQVSLDMRTKQT
nr:helix-turn-helix domain-containing protein [Bifidobacterium catenulatum]